MRTAAHLLIALAVLIGQGASNLNLCQNCAQVCFDIDDAHSHDAGDGHECHDFVPLEQHESCQDTQNDAAYSKTSNASRTLAAAPLHAFSAAALLNTLCAFVPRATESPPPRPAPLQTYTLRC